MSGGGGKPRGDGKRDPKGRVAKVSPDQGQPPSRIRIEFPLEHMRVLVRAHQKTVSTVAWSPDNTTIATGGLDGRVLLWELRDLTHATAEYDGHHSAISKIVWSADSQLLASYAADGTTHVWRRSDGRLITQVTGRVMDIRHNKRELIYFAGQRLVRWDIDRKKDLQTVEEGPVVDARYAPSGRWLAVLSHSTKLVIFDLSSLEQTRREVVLPVKPYYPELRFPDDARILVHLSDGQLCEIDPAAGRITNRLMVARPTPPGAQPTVTYGKLTPDGSHVIEYCDVEHEYAIVNTQTDQRTPAPDKHAHMRPATPGEWLSPGGTRCLTHKGATSLQLYDLLAGKAITEFSLGSRVTTPELHRIYGRRFLARLSYELPAFDLVGGGQFGEIHKRSTNDTSWMAHVTSDGELLAFVDDHVESSPTPANPSLRFETFPKLDGFAKRGTYDRTGWLDDGERIWHRLIDEKRIDVWNTRTGARVASFAIEDGLRRNPFSSPTVNILLRWTGVGNTDQLGLRVWRFTDRDKPEVRDIYVELQGHSLISPDGSRIAVEAGSGRWSKLIFHSTTDGQRLCELTLPKAISRQLSIRAIVEISTTGKYLILMNEIWNIDSSPPQRVWQADRRPRSAWSFSSTFLGDERHVVIRQEYEIEVWDFLKNKKRQTIYELPDNEWL
jgi:hypothetical protein